MKKVLITGGAGTVGTAFIKKYYNKYKTCRKNKYSKNQKY